MGNPEDELWLQELENPAIPFHKQEDEEEQPTAEKDESRYFQVNTSLATNQATGKDILKKDICSHSILKYQGGTPEQYCKWRQQMHNLFSKRGCPDMVNDHAAQLSLYRGALDGNALETFNLAYSLREDEDFSKTARSHDAFDFPVPKLRRFLHETNNTISSYLFDTPIDIPHRYSLSAPPPPCPDCLSAAASSDRLLWLFSTELPRLLHSAPDDQSLHHLHQQQTPGNSVFPNIVTVSVPTKSPLPSYASEIRNCHYALDFTIVAIFGCYFESD